MAEKLIKSFTIGSDIGKVDYNSLANQPFTAAEVADLKAKLAVVTPKYAHFSVAAEDKAKIAKVHIHKYACPERFDDEPEGYKVENDKILSAVIMARDGDFGYHAIDGTGQINFTIEFQPDYQNGYVVIPEITPVVAADKPFGNFKSKYSTGLNCPLGTAKDYLGLVSDGIYRITKVTTDINVVLHVYKESELPAHTITYNLVLPEDLEASDVTVNAFRVVDGIEKVWKYGIYDSTEPVSESNPANGYPKEFIRPLTFTGTTATDYTYNDASGFRSNATYTDGSAGLQFTVELPEGYTYSASISGTSKTDYSKFEYSTDFNGYWCANKVGKDLEVTITVAAPVDVSTDEQTYKFGDVLNKATTGQPFTFEVYYNVDKSNNNENKKLIPEPAGLAKKLIESITVGGVALDLDTDVSIDDTPTPGKYQTWTDKSGGVRPYPEYYLLDDETVGPEVVDGGEIPSKAVPKCNGVSGKKAMITIAGEKVTGDIVITSAEAYAVTYTPGATIFSEESKHVPTHATKDVDFTFKFYQFADKHEDSSIKDNKAIALAKIESITVGGTPLTLTEDLINNAGKGKVTVVIPGTSVTGAVVVKLAD